MTRRAWIAVFVLLATVAICFIKVWPRQPHYHGRSLSAWLVILDDHEGWNGIVWDTKPLRVPSKEQLEAAEAVRQMGSSAMPELLRMLQTKESVWPSVKGTILNLLPPRFRPAVRAGRPTPESTIRHRAALGLVALDPSAKPMVSQLVPVFNKPMLCKEAAYVLASMGQEGLPPLQSAIKTALKKTAPPAWQGASAVWALGQFPTNGQVIMPDVLAGLTNKNPGFRVSCAWAMTRLQTDPEVAVQALTNYVTVPGMRYLCLKALENYGPRAKSAVPFLVEMLRTEKRSRARDVADALMAIDPDEAEKGGF